MVFIWLRCHSLPNRVIRDPDSSDRDPGDHEEKYIYKGQRNKRNKYGSDVIRCLIG